jgi:hypothetical protein
VALPRPSVLGKLPALHLTVNIGSSHQIVSLSFQRWYPIYPLILRKISRLSRLLLLRLTSSLSILPGHGEIWGI